MTGHVTAGMRRPLWIGLGGLCLVAAVTTGTLLLRNHETPVPAPVPAAPAEPGGPAKPTFDVVRVGPEGEAVMAGRAAPGAEVVIEDGGKEIGRTKADSHGDWVFTSDKPMPPGPQALTLAERAPDGQEIKGSGTVFLAVPNPTETQVAANKAGAPVAVLSDPNAPPRILQNPGQAHLGLGAVDYGEHGDLRFAGSSPPGTSVRVYVDNRPVGDATADSTGQWTLSPQARVAPGPHRLRLDQLGSQGQVVARVELPFTREPPRNVIAEGSIVVQPGQNLWQMARQAYGSGVRYTVIFRANRTQIRDPNLIYPGQLFAVPDAEAAAVTPPSSSRSR